ncbi:hypothetical protein PT2222_20375 [Paraburkholderia tropica]
MNKHSFDFSPLGQQGVAFGRLADRLAGEHAAERCMGGTREGRAAPLDHDETRTCHSRRRHDAECPPFQLTKDAIHDSLTSFGVQNIHDDAHSERHAFRADHTPPFSTASDGSRRASEPRRSHL